MKSEHGQIRNLTKEFKGDENTAYHDIIALFKIYRSVNWRMQIKINQVEAVELMRKYHPNGERYYWVLYYSYMSACKAENVDEILDKLEPHFPKITRIHRATYFRWREQAFEAVSGILWGMKGKA